MAGGAKKLPFENKSTNTFGYMSQDPNNEYVQDFREIPLDPDPGAERRGNLREQELENSWNGAFLSGVPDFIRKSRMDSAMREARSDTAAERRQANYQANLAKVARAGQLLPQLVQTGGTSSGFQSQYQPGFWDSFKQGFGSSLGGFLGGGAGFRGWGG